MENIIELKDTVGGWIIWVEVKTVSKLIRVFVSVGVTEEERREWIPGVFRK